MDCRVIGERSDAVLRTAMASEATPFFERLWRAKRRRSSNGYGERSDAVLRTAMASEATPFFERLWRAKRRRSSNGYGERSDAVLRTAMPGNDEKPSQFDRNALYLASAVFCRRVGGERVLRPAWDAVAAWLAHPPARCGARRRRAWPRSRTSRRPTAWPRWPC